jgi:hypothetical protein
VTARADDAFVEFPPVDLPAIDLVQGFAMQSPQLSFDGSGAGVMELGSGSYSVYPFNAVDCSTGCGTPGWYELHSVLWDPTTADACFGIYYLFVESPPVDVQLDYVLCLPTLEDPTAGGVSLSAMYSYPDAG